MLPASEHLPGIRKLVDRKAPPPSSSLPKSVPRSPLARGRQNGPSSPIGGPAPLRGRMDLCPRYGEVILGIELKVWRDGEKDPLAEGLEQLDGYLSGLDLQDGWLVVFDRRTGVPPIGERTTATEATSPGGRTITVIRG